MTTNCPSCGVAYSDHIGLIGTCAQVQALRAVLVRNAVRQRAADKLARSVARLVESRKLSSRSEASDALLAYLGVGGLDGPTSVPEWCEKYDREHAT